MVGKSNTIFYFLPVPVVHTGDIFNVNTTGMVSWDCVCRHCKLCCFCTHCQILHEQPDIWTGHFELISDLKTEDKNLTSERRFAQNEMYIENDLWKVSLCTFPLVLLRTWDSISSQVYREPLCLFYIRGAKWPKYLPMCSFLMIRCYCRASHEHVKTVLTGRQWGLGGWPRIITRLLLAKKISIESGVNL